MLSKFASACTKCSQPIAKGEFIAWSKHTGAMHGKCAGYYPPENPSAHRYPCWDCKSPDGIMRNQGAATPVLCDACDAARKERDAKRWQPDPIDIQYEDDCAARCGLL
jgi:hypothetical protein